MMTKESEHHKQRILEEGAVKSSDMLNQDEIPTKSGKQEINSDSQEPIFCIPGGKCYTLDELKKNDKSKFPKLGVNGESKNAEKQTHRRDQQSN